VFFGYSNIHKGFKYLDISSVRIYISCDVIFDESIFWFASLNSNVGAPYHSDVLLLPPSQTGDNGTTNMTEVITVSVSPMVRPPVQLQQNHRWLLYKTRYRQYTIRLHTSPRQ
jgi:hypothetical protein